MPKNRSHALSADESMLVYQMPGDERRFVTLEAFCEDTECRAIHLGLLEVDAQDRPLAGARPIWMSLHADTWREIPTENQSPEERWLVEAFIADLDDASRAFLRVRFDTSKEETRRIASYSMPPEEVLDGTLVSYVNVLTGGQSIRYGGDVCSFSFVHAGTTYVIEDLYCPNPECDCRKASLLFARLQETPGGKTLVDSFWATLRLSGSSSVNDVLDCSKIVARKVLSAWKKSEPGLTDTIRQRYAQVKEVGRRSLAGTRGIHIAGQPPSRSPQGRGRRVGRNAPCSCGSGRKYKHCCGKTG